MKSEEIIVKGVIDCDQCLKELSYEINADNNVSKLPDGWMEISEGSPIAYTYEFCSPDCLIKWHERDKNERFQYHSARVAKIRAKRDKENKLSTAVYENIDNSK